MTDQALPAPRTAGPKTVLRRNGALLALALLLVFNAAVTPNFVSLQTLNVNLTQVAPIVIVAVGMTLVIATGGIDLSVGSLMAIAGQLAPLIFTSRVATVSSALAIVLGMILPVAAVTALGWLNGLVITRYRIQPIVATLVLYIAGRGIAQVMTNGNLQVFHEPGFQFIGLGRVFGFPVQAILMLAAVAAGAAVLRRSLIGRQILAIGGNERAARLAGIPVMSGETHRLRGQRLRGRARRARHHRDQLVVGRQSRGFGHGARRDRGCRGRRHAAGRRAGDGLRARWSAPASSSWSARR